MIGLTFYFLCLQSFDLYLEIRTMGKTKLELKETSQGTQAINFDLCAKFHRTKRGTVRRENLFTDKVTKFL